jgi:hypothetical protein
LNDNKKTRIDSNGIDGKVLNEASTKAIIQVKEDKKKKSFKSKLKI